MPPFLQAPEVFLGHTYDDRCDVFSWSIIAYEVLHRYQMISATDGSLDECQVSMGAWPDEGGVRGIAAQDL